MVDVSISSINWRLFKESHLDRASVRGAVPSLSYAYHEGPGRWLGYACLAELGFQIGQFHSEYAFELGRDFKHVVSQPLMRDHFKSSAKPLLVDALRDRLSSANMASNSQPRESAVSWNAVANLWIHAQEASARTAVELLDREAAAEARTSMSIALRVQRLLRDRLTEDEARVLVEDLVLVSEFVELYAHFRALVSSIAEARVTTYVRDLFETTAFNAKGRGLYTAAITIWSTLNPAVAELADTSTHQMLASESVKAHRQAYE